MKDRIKILVVGQVPPPFHGQAIMVQNMLEADYELIKLYHVRMNFSSDIDEIGRFQFKKIWELISVIFRIFKARITTGAKILYYPPAGPNLNPVLRDIIILTSTRWLFKKTVFHFHAAGVSHLYKDLPKYVKPLYKWAYFNTASGIRLSEHNPEDPKFLKTKNEFVIPNGVPHVSDQFEEEVKNRDNERPVLLFVGLMKASKGAKVLLESCQILKANGYDFLCQFMGNFDSAEFEQEMRSYIAENDLEENVKFLGVLSGKAKHLAFANSDMLVFPTYYESETFGLVLVEAMQFEMPVVSTYWRGIPSIVKDGENGFLVPTQDPKSVAEKVGVLLDDPQLRERMGRRGKEIYLEKYTDKIHHQEMEKMFVNTANF